MPSGPASQREPSRPARYPRDSIGRQVEGPSPAANSAIDRQDAYLRSLLVSYPFRIVEPGSHGAVKIPGRPRSLEGTS